MLDNMAKIVRVISVFLFLFTVALGDKDAKIIKGRLARKNEFPYAVALTGDSGAFCGGVLITLDKVLTAGHCVAFQTIFGLMTRNVFVAVAGSVKKDFSTRADGIRMRHIISVQLHPKYEIKKLGDSYHDIAGLVLAKPFDPTSSLLPMKCIWESSEEYKEAWNNHVRSGNNCIAIGWGFTKKDGKKFSVLSPDLKVVELKPAGDEYCSIYATLKGDKDMTKQGEVCLKMLKDGEGPCNGDSGGPLICNGRVFGLMTSVYYACADIEYHSKYLLFWPYMDIYNFRSFCYNPKVASHSTTIFEQKYLILFLAIKISS